VAVTSRPCAAHLHDYDDLLAEGYDPASARHFLGPGFGFCADLRPIKLQSAALSLQPDRSAGGRNR